MNQQPILIVDDDPAVRNIVRQVLALEGYTVFEAATGREGLQAWGQRDPQLVILDIVMPGLSGLQVLQQIREGSNTPIIMLTRRSSEGDKVQAFELGTDDYLSKPFSSRELTVRVKAVLRRTYRPPLQTEPTELTAGDLRLDLRLHRASIGDRVVPLSRTEFQILVELARIPGRVLSRKQLVTTVWGPEYRDDMRVLRCAIYRLRQKLEREASQPSFLRGERDVGYWLAVSEEAEA